MKYKHLFLTSGQTVTIVSDLDQDKSILTCQFAICSSKDKYIRKEGNAIALDRLQKDPIFISITENDNIEHNWLTWLTLSGILSKIVFSDQNYSVFYPLIHEFRFYQKRALIAKVKNQMLDRMYDIQDAISEGWSP